MTGIPTIEIKEVDDLHFGPVPMLIIDFGDDIGQIATTTAFEPYVRDLLQRLTGAEEALRQIQYAKMAGLQDAELAVPQNCERCTARCLALTKIADKWLCGRCCFIDGFNSAKRGEPPWWRNEKADSTEDGEAMDLACGDPDCCGWVPRKNCANCDGTGSDRTGRPCARCDGDGEGVVW
jgi:hypothetical protein